MKKSKPKVKVTGKRLKTGPRPLTGSGSQPPTNPPPKPK